MNQPAEIPFYLEGNFAPVFEERTVDSLEVIGTIPPELNGRLLRNGPIRKRVGRAIGFSATA